ncbi:MAG: hypothetical protein C0478_11190 [Planctomyces sp.]|nr:hypothetical protein [Planctomyces sp.]
MTNMPMLRQSASAPAQSIARWARNCAAWGLLGLMLAVEANAADIVIRKGGARVGGEAVATKAGITVKPQAGDEVSIPLADVQSVEWDSMPATFKIALSDLAAGRYDKAIESLSKLKSDGKLPNDNVKKEVGYALARAKGLLAQTNAAKVDDAVKELKAIQASDPDFYQYFPSVILLGDLLVNKGSFDEAAKVFESFDAVTDPSLKLQGRSYVGRVLLAQGKVPEAIKAFDEVIAASGTDEALAPRKLDAMVGKARAAVQKNQYAEALPLLDEVMANLTEASTGVGAETKLLQGNSLQALNKPMEAVLSYLYVDLNYPNESAARAEALYHLTNLWRVVQHPDRGLEARARLEADYPGSPWAKKLAGN